MRIGSFLNIVNWLPNYKKAHLKSDAIAGLTVGIMLIPQGMAYAIIAGLPPVYGLYASLVPIIVYAILGTSRQLAVGPVAMDSLLVASFIGTLAEIGTDYYISLAIFLATIMGAIQLIMGILRMGFLVNFLSKPVINGFTSAAAIIIGLSQLKHLLGADIPRSNQIQYLLVNIYNNISYIHLPTITIGIIAILIISLIKKFKIRIPAPLIVVVLGTSIVGGLSLNQEGVKIVGEIPSGFPSFILPDINFALLKTILPMAFTIALVAFMEAISVAKAIQPKHNDYEIDSNKELIALGAANLIGSFFQSYPTTGGFSRTAVNDQSGAKTPLASLISVALIALTLLFFTPLFYYLPKSILAAIILVAVFGLIDIQYPKKLWKSNKVEFFMLLATFVTTLTIGITTGIITGVILSLIVMIYFSTRPHIAILGRIPNTNQFRNIDRFDHLETRDDVLIIRFDAQMYFANSQYFKDKLGSLIKEKPYLKLLILNMESVNMIDSSSINMLQRVHDNLISKNIKVYFTGTIGPVRDVLSKSGFLDEVGKKNFFLDIHFALKKYDDDFIDNKVNQHAIQTNK